MFSKKGIFYFQPEPRVENLGSVVRPCEVDGRAGCLFHRWVEEDTILISAESEPVFSRHTLAMVEYPDGSVGKVRPELVTFLDRGCG